MTGRYTASFPRTVSGKNFREPLDHPVVEALGAEMDRLYREIDLTDLQRGRILKDYSALMQHDDKFIIWFRENHIPDLTVDEIGPTKFIHCASYDVRLADLFWRIRRRTDELKNELPTNREPGDDI